MDVNSFKILLLVVFSTFVLLFFSGTIHSDARPVHEEWPGLRPRLLHHRAVHLQRPPGSPGANSQSQGNVRLIPYLKILWPYKPSYFFWLIFWHFCSKQLLGKALSIVKSGFLPRTNITRLVKYVLAHRMWNRVCCTGFGEEKYALQDGTYSIHKYSIVQQSIKKTKTLIAM